jgi:glycosyltransferase involved in cell wall biosynthesis
MVTIIVPIYNSEKYIKRCLDSVCAQSYTDLEIILVNDGSTDNSLNILQEYAESDNRIKVVNQENKGVAAARNTGLRNATGDFILYVDSDDWIEKNMVQRMLELMEDADIVFCSSDHADSSEKVEKEDSQNIEIWNQKKQQSEFMKHKRMTGMLWNKLIRRTLTTGISFNEKTGYGEDAEFLWKVLKRSKKMVVTNEILYHHVLEDSSISHLTFSDKKYSAILMWESIVAEVEKEYPQLLNLAKERLMCAAVYSLYEIRCVGYANKKQIKYMRQIARKGIINFLKSSNISMKFKLYAIAVCLGY